MNEKFVTHNREPFFEIAKNLINSGDNVLDIGAGNGSFADFCKHEDVYLFEGNMISVKYLNTKYKNVFLGQLPELPFKDSFFDVIHMSHVIEHLEPQEVYDTLKEFDRCCKPGGVIVISAPLMWEGFYDDLSHVKPYNPYIFMKYMCSGNKNNYTREAITDKYSVENLQYRFQESRMFYGLKESKRLVAKLIFKIYEFLRVRGFKQYRKTGYTIVLRKEE
ncbi:class I SAM-dependent methyltransferase [Autumnicola edwardsiae]|uniref:Methyltransferase domain-containing protein n=1 Tax=Autumnicola edwardsiae TaxID=3075594 RepID=A0ABU3CWS0_9FLAO|nr:methyltransferase domain-containing protein [Zunongwangia sp. F297]MDT0650823.1 methyltransferase domain-containing protein [Zunongwangia sp. F297]